MLFPRPSVVFLACLAAAGPLALAQSATPPDAVRPVADPAAAAPQPAATQRVEVTGGREGETELRRRSTAAKIVIGRDEIAKFGDATIGEMLKRLPGVTVGGQPGRGGAIRMRGLGSGYTQILLDGERVQGGLSLDSLDPDQIERIEIIRAPTAETGARAIGGTINIITREGFVKRLNDLRLSVGLENGRTQPGLSWTRDDKLGNMDYNVALSTYRGRRADASTVQTQNSSDDRTEQIESLGSREGAHLSGRLQWKLADGASLMLMPLMVVSHSDSRASSVFAPASEGTLPYLSSASHSEGQFSLLRLNSLWRSPLWDGRVELRTGVGQGSNSSHTWRTEAKADGGSTHYDDQVSSRERTLTLNGKYSRLLEGDHSLVSGVELDSARRNESRTQLLDQLPVTDGFGDNLRASSLRSAAYAQDEWQLSPNWAAHAGLRWEGIVTEGGAVDAAAQRNRSSVWTPLLHAVWKPDPKGQDQIRMSLTRSYRAPTLATLVGATWRAKGENSQTNADRSGNPDLRPELATGVDIALERYLAGGGMLSANVFRRTIGNLMRSVTSLETQADGSQRWVARTRNIGDAVTQGVELEAKFKLSDVQTDWPGVDVRANASVFQSRVAAVPGPDNRLDQQPGGTLNLGADYRFPGTPLTLGANVNWTPGYTTRLTDTQWLIQSDKRVLDAYLMWQVNPLTRLRLSGSNLDPRVSESVSQVGDESATTVAQTFVNWRLQLELKL
jgi:outer membrane receptor for ferrienterochelin and colicins